MGQAMLKNCPVCQRPAVEKYRPFCCERCAQVDLGRWFSGKYSVPTDEKPEESGAENETEDNSI